METKTKIKNKNPNKISFIIALFFALAQVSQANIVLGASISEEEMIRLTNESRAEAELPLLLANEKLAEAAMKKADDMFANQYFDHNSPNGKTPWGFIKSAGYEYRFAGENLAIDFITAGGAHKALMESASHRENILNINYTEIGIAAIEGIFDGNKSIIIVEEFGAPLKKEVVADHNLNENIELILEEKVNEFNNLKGDGEEEEKLEEFSQTGLPTGQAGLPTGQAGSTQVCLPDREEHGASELGEESVDRQNDNLSLSDLSADFGIWNPAFRLLENGQDKTLYHNYETLNGKFRQLGTRSAGCNLDEEKSSNAIIEDKPILLAGNLNNEKVMGLVNKAYAKDEHIKKYDHQQKPIGPAVNRYFQKEFIESVLSFYAILAVLLILDFIFIICYYKRKDNNIII